MKPEIMQNQMFDLSSKTLQKTLLLELFTASSASVWTSKILQQQQQLGMSNLEDRCWGHNPENPGIFVGFVWVHQKLSFCTWGNLARTTAWVCL
jgi:hypothetical protein